MGMQWQERPAKLALLDSGAYPTFPAVSRRDVRQVCARAGQTPTRGSHQRALRYLERDTTMALHSSSFEHLDKSRGNIADVLERGQEL